MAMSVALHEHVTALLTVLEWMDEHADVIAAAGGELPAELEELFDEVEGDLREKLKRVALMERTVKANADVATAEANRIQAIARGWENKRKGLRTYMGMQLRRLGEVRVDFPTVKVRLQDASSPAIRHQGEPPTTAIDAAAVPFWDLIPARYEFNYRKALDYLKERGLLDKDAAERQPDGTLRLDLAETHGVVVEWTQSAIVW